MGLPIKLASSWIFSKKQGGKVMDKLKVCIVGCGNIL